MKAKSLDSWRNFFHGANSSIFEIIDHAIIVAATDHPKEFRLQRGQIAEQLYSCQWTEFCGCNHNGLAIPKKTKHHDLTGECVHGMAKNWLTGHTGDLVSGRGKQTKVDNHMDDHEEMAMSQVSKYCYREAEALIDEIDEENGIFDEVIRIKELLDNSQEQSETVLFESLRRLQLMVPSVEVLQATKIGKAVNSLRGHWSKQISQFARTLVSGWKTRVKDWIDAAAALEEGFTYSSPCTIVDKEGLPFPPLDEGALFATQIPTELSQFFDGIDDDGNPMNSMVDEKNHERGREPLPEKQTYTKNEPKIPKKAITSINDKKDHLIQLKSVDQVTEPSKTESGPRISQKPTLVQNSNNKSEFRNNPYWKISNKSPSISTVQDRHKILDNVGFQAKLEATKRKLQDGYQEAEKARKQRRTQFLDFDQLPKPKLGPRNPLLRHKNHSPH